MVSELVEPRSETEAAYWVGEFCRHGMILSQAENLAECGCDRHAVRVALEQDCDPDLVFLIFS